MGLAGIPKSTVSKLCKDIDERVNAFLDRPSEGEWPHLWLDATYLKVRGGGRIVSVAAIIAVAVDTEGRREIVGLHPGPSEAETFWAQFLEDLLRRGLAGVRLAVSDAHGGLKAAIAKVPGATWQRCRAHTIRTQSTVCPPGSLTTGRWAVQRDDMADLQAALVNDDALDDEPQDRLLVGEARLVETAADPIAEGGQVAQHRPGLDLLTA